MTDSLSEATTDIPPSAANTPPRAPKPDVFPVLEQLSALHPQLFGAEFRPLKRGIFQDLIDAHPEAFARDALKAALAFHTRSTRYLSALASGQPRHDLQGQAVEATAPEHVYQALIEVFRRRQNRTQENLTPKLVARIAQAFTASGLSAPAYAELVHGRDEAANAALDEAMSLAQEHAAKDEALLRAFEASGAASVAAFADMYGMQPRAVAAQLERARTGAQSRAAVTAG